MSRDFYTNQLPVRVPKAQRDEEREKLHCVATSGAVWVSGHKNKFGTYIRGYCRRKYTSYMGKSESIITEDPTESSYKLLEDMTGLKNEKLHWKNGEAITTFKKNGKSYTFKTTSKEISPDKWDVKANIVGDE